jgi:hypothetical protein
MRDPELQRLVEEALRPVIPILKKPMTRFIMEREPAIVASEKIVERLKKAEAKNQIEKKKAAALDAAAEET